MKKKLDCLLDLLIAFSLATIVTVIFLTFFNLSKVSGISMEGTLHDKDYTLLCRSSYWFSEPERGDIVNAYVHDDLIVVKRIIGIPGDTIEIKNNVMYVNDVAISEDYIKEPMKTRNVSRIKLEEDQYFLCGDNRNKSLDSRFSYFGLVTKDKLLGKVVFNFSEFKKY